ncbi:MAG: 23S rRNA (uracil(1939)-C(5))-methyltransferase RlmD [Balneolaceae bacterium]
MSLKKGSEIEAIIESTAFKGKGVAKIDGIPIFIPATAPGDRVRARITKRKKSFREATLLEVLEPSPERIKPTCSHAPVCGGCTWQHLPYTIQLREKEQHVRDHIERIARLDPALVQPVIGCEEPFYYRNKMEYSFGTRRWLTDDEIQRDEYVDDSGFAAGLHAPGRFDKILNLNECHLQDPISYEILDWVRTYCMTHDIPAFDTFKKEGMMRHLMIRNAYHTDDLMVNLVTYREDRDTVQEMANGLLEQFPQITTLVQNVNDQPNPTAVGRYERVLHGPGFITDQIGPYSFKIHPNAFFQTNTAQAERLYDVAAQFCDPQPGDVLYDLYCGVGTLSLFLSKHVKEVIGIELVDVAIENARFNADENSVPNVRFVLGDMKETFNQSFLDEHPAPDCILTDPPRSGMHPDVVQQLNDLAVPKLVYVSCNPSTMARDLQLLSEVYDVQTVQPVDMFPQTYHIEAVAKLTRK